MGYAEKWKNACYVCIVVVLGYMLFYKYYVALFLIRRLSFTFQQELNEKII